MTNTLVRQWHILELLPPAPKRTGIDVAGLEAGLRERGVVAHRRTIQRDLVFLALLFPIAVNERSKPYTWRWKDGAVPPFLVLAPT